MSPAMVIRNLRPENEVAVREYLDERLTDYLTPDVSTYAQGRMRCWLEAEAPLGPTRPWQHALHDERLWSWCKSLWPQAEIGLVTRGPIGIDLHRDASYASFEACSINLGTCTWLYEPRYQTLHYGPQYTGVQVQEFALTGGEVMRFNCKNRHGAVELGEHRWSINLWRVASKSRAGFERVRH